jgi:hypothetical protein
MGFPIQSSGSTSPIHVFESYVLRSEGREEAKDGQKSQFSGLQLVQTSIGTIRLAIDLVKWQHRGKQIVHIMTYKLVEVVAQTEAL